MSEWKETELGVIPNEWEIQNSSIYCTKITDGTHDSPKQVLSGYPLITSKHIKSDSIDFEEAYLISQEDYEAIIKRSKVDQYDLIISMIGEYCGFTYLETSQQVNYATKNVGLFKNKSKTHALWLKYYLDSPIGKHQLKLRRSGTSQPYISLGSLRSLPILNPKSDITMQSIVNVLSCLDAKIENLRRQNETLEAIAQTLFKHWFIDFEFSNADGKPYKSSGGAMVRSELGEIPEGWHVGKLGDVVNINSQSIDKNYPHKKIEYVDISSVGVGVLEDTTQYKLYEAPSRARRLVKHGDVIWSGVRPNRKSYLFICKPIENLVVSTGFIVLSPKQIPSSYLYAWVTTSMFVDYLTLNASGSAYPAVKAEHFEIAEIVLPSKAILKHFHSIIDPMRMKTHENSRQIQTLTKTRDSLLPKLMSGQIRVKE